VALDKATIDFVMDAIVARGCHGSARTTFFLIRQMCAFAYRCKWMAPLHDSLTLSDYGVKNGKGSRVLSEAELVQLFRYLDRAPLVACAHLVVDDLIRVAVLTGLRSSELRESRAEDWKDGILTIPAPRTKSNRELKLKLSPVAAAIVEARAKSGGLLFPNGRGNVLDAAAFRREVEKVRIAAGIEEKFTVHDFRRTLRQRLGYLAIDFFVAEATIGHALPGMVQTYQPLPLVERIGHALRLHEAWLLALLANAEREARG
jgi:integrase